MKHIHSVQYAQRIQVPLRSCSWITGIEHILLCQLVWVFTLSESFMGTDEDPCQDSLQWSTWTERLTHCIQIDKNSYTQLPSRSRCFWLLAEPVHWSCSSKYMCPLINFAFQGVVVEVELTAKFCLYCFEPFRLKIIRDTIIFLIIYYIKLFFPSFLKTFDW